VVSVSAEARNDDGRGTVRNVVFRRGLMIATRRREVIQWSS
jgi:hypothetical protein